MNFTKSTALAKGDTLLIREAINEAILNSRINKPIEITDTVDELVLEYGEKLSRFNFGNKILQKEQDKHLSIVQRKQQNKLIEEVNKLYSEKYPNHTIIPMSDLTQILKKYDLYSGDTKYYSKLIPQTNLNVMTEFWDEHSTEKYGFGNFDLNKLNDLNIADARDLKYSYNDDYYSRRNELRVDTSSLQIIAPLNEFELGEEEKVIGNFIVHDREWDEKNIKKPRPINLDPIVWIPVKYPSIGGAALIITQWGPEADIPEFN